MDYLGITFPCTYRSLFSKIHVLYLAHFCGYNQVYQNSDGKYAHGPSGQFILYSPEINPTVSCFITLCTRDYYLVV
ncbi:hypothetical protein Hmuk_3217 [Halomicrobium mukohataei DSM 12286]|uniref:Uncharacterized protein n=1 Tax=Halomicrobium mukohataei (strain ATCC 700874 / DSM 12286 / JCM 9738 / NCIMB 13541) TaxID=485914 RepID=C7P2K5_HALMD|nr:hypothetical protein Hmuk_3217 [Halomicrobium mukohataei DSM 12286]